ncbi:hypothetical protein KBI52_04370 [Microvirga sp. HBU67558]|uniref:hypothetical protein n=1 Tax=Microvirga TaxID=186650 RepID=UPI001B37D796|nr:MULTISPECIES: hypothetical protein [unclassified Microvirga]MBQ0819462.1 hypothetical protein [Microvirga sp. HBU67558]
MKDHHFGHHSSGNERPCRTGPETALHKFAKEVLARRLHLFLPTLDLTEGEDRWIGFEGRIFNFDSALLENRLGSIVPDVIVRKGDRDLLVEFAVTHECGPEKIAQIEEMNLSAIEIDLSGISHEIDSREGLERAILDKAPRKWLHNPMLRDGQAALDARRQQRAEQFGRRIAALRATYIKARTQINITVFAYPAVARIAEDNLTRAIGIAVPGYGCFTVPAQDWQATILADMVDIAASGKRTFISVQGALRKIRDRGWIDHRFSRLTEAEAEAIRQVEADFALPQDAIHSWIVSLAKAGILVPASDGKQWILNRFIGAEVQNARYRRALPDIRMRQIRSEVGEILAALPQEETKAFSFEHWAGQPLPGRAYSIRQIVRFDDRQFAQFEAEFSKVRSCFRSNAVLGADVFGLPLAGYIARQKERQRQQKEADEQARQALLREQANRRVQNLQRRVQDVLGPGWSDWPFVPNADLNGVKPVDAAQESEEGFWKAARLASDLSHRLEQEHRAHQIAEKARQALRKEASKVHAGPLLDLYMNTAQPVLGRKSPFEYCVDEASMNRCIELTLPIKKRR